MGLILQNDYAYRVHRAPDGQTTLTVNFILEEFTRILHPGREPEMSRAMTLRVPPIAVVRAPHPVFCVHAGPLPQATVLVDVTLECVAVLILVQPDALLGEVECRQGFHRRHDVRFRRAQAQSRFLVPYPRCRRYDGVVGVGDKLARGNRDILEARQRDRGFVHDRGAGAAVARRFGRHAGRRRREHFLAQTSPRTIAVEAQTSEG